MRRLNPQWLLLPIVALSSLVTHEARASDFEPGVIEVSLAGSANRAAYSSDGRDKGTETNIDLLIGVGNFLSRTLELHGEMSYRHTSTDLARSSSGSATAFGLGGSLILNIPTPGTIVPFARAGVAGILYDGDRRYEGDDISINLPSLGIGVRSLVGRSGSLNVSLDYRRVVDARGRRDLRSHEFCISVGVSLFLWWKTE